jgi:hypothetical protein
MFLNRARDDVKYLFKTQIESVFDFDKLGSEKTYRIRFFQEGSEQQRICGTRKDTVDGIFKHLQGVYGSCGRLS